MKRRGLLLAAGLLSCLVVSTITAQAPDTLRFRILWEVAEGHHATADSLGDLSGIAVDTAGIVYVSDISAKKLWVFDQAGRSLPAIGRKGGGPGEFEAPTGLGIGPDGRLYVRDLTRVTRFTLDKARGRLSQYSGEFRGPVYADWTSKLAPRFDHDGRLYYPSFNTVGRLKRSGAYYRYSASGTLADSIVVPPFDGAPASTASVCLSATGGRMLRGLNHVPFAPLPTWDATPRGTVLIGMATSYQLREIDASGRVVRTYQRTIAPDRIPPNERRDSLAALRARLDSVPVPLDRVDGMPDDVRSARVPATYPAFMRAYAATDGRVWVRRWSATATSVFDVFEADGRLRWVVILPRVIAVEPTPALTLDGVAAIGVDAESGANTIVRFAPAERR